MANPDLSSQFDDVERKNGDCRSNHPRDAPSGGLITILTCPSLGPQRVIPCNVPFCWHKPYETYLKDVGQRAKTMTERVNPLP